MKFKVLILFVCILLVGTAVSKEGEVTAKFVEKGSIRLDEIATDQSGRRNFLAVATCSCPLVDNTIETVISRSDSRFIDHYLEYYSDAGKRIFIYLLITGPEFASHVSDRLTVQANTFYYYSVNWPSTWKSGVYKATWIIEVVGGKGGSTLVESNSFIVY